MRPRLASLLLMAPLVLPACSGDSNSDGAGGGENELRAKPHEACPVGAPVGVDDLFARRAGAYTFVPQSDECGMSDARVTAGTSYAVTLQASPKALLVATDDGQRTYAWDGPWDLACEGGSTSLVEVGWDEGFVRASFLGEDPYGFLLGLCIGTLSR